MNFEKLMDALADGDDEIEIHIKHKVDDEDECSGCDKDSCPIDIDDIDDTPLEEKEFKNFREFIDFLTSLDDDDKEEDDDDEDAAKGELKEYEDSAKEAYLEAVKEKGQEKADAILKISAAEATIQQAMHEKLPLREEDVKAYNDTLKFLIDPPEFLVDLKYFLIDKANKEAMAELKK